MKMAKANKNDEKKQKRLAHERTEEASCTVLEFSNENNYVFEGNKKIEREKQRLSFLS